MKVYLSRKTAKTLKQTPSDFRRRLEAKISELSQTPYPAGCRKLNGAANAYRVRVGDYRILYTLIAKDEILIFKIARRETAYL